MIRPIKPEEVEKEVRKPIPEWVIEGVNKCIVKHYSFENKRAFFNQNELIDFILKEAPKDINRQQLFKNHWLDIESIFENAGWKVTYYRPPYYEPGPPTFTFKVKE